MEDRLAGDRLLRVGAVTTGIGLLCCLVAIAPLVFGGTPPSFLWFLAMITGLGLALVLLGLAVSSRARGAHIARAAREIDEAGD